MATQLLHSEAGLTADQAISNLTIAFVWAWLGRMLVPAEATEAVMSRVPRLLALQDKRSQLLRRIFGI